MKKTKLELIENWDDQISENKVNSFVGREYYINWLADIIKRKSGGSILIAGELGVGKTSLIRKVILDLKEKEKKKFIVSTVKATQLEAYVKYEKTANGQEIKITAEGFKNFVQILATRLYKESLNPCLSKKKLKEKILNLYQKSSASKYFRTEESRKEDIRSLIVEASYESKVNLLELVASIALIFTLFTVLQFSEKSISNIYVRCIFDFIKLVGVGGLSYFSLTALFEVKKSKNSSNNDLQNEKYEFDASPFNLEYDLEEVHKSLEDNKYKTVYIIDELDKTSNDFKRAIFQSCKHFFNQGNALYIFISDDKYYIGEYLSEISSLNRDTPYTFFNYHLFLPRANHSDLMKYLKKIFNLNESKIQEADRFFSYLIFNSRSDFFELNRIIQNKLTFVKGKSTIIYSDEEIIKNSDKLQKCIELVCNYHSKNETTEYVYNNERIRKELYNICETVLKNKEFNHFNESIVEKPKKELLSAVEDFIRLLTKLKFITYVRNGPAIENTELVQKVYRPTNDFDYDVPDKMNIKTTHDELFISLFTMFKDFIDELAIIVNAASGEDKINLKSSIQTKIDKLAMHNINFKNYKNYVNMHEELNKIPPTHYTIEELDEAMDNIQGVLDKSDISNFNNLILSFHSRLIKRGISVYRNKVNTHQLQNQVGLRKFSEFNSRVLQTNHEILFNTISRKIAIFFAPNQNLEAIDLSLIEGFNCEVRLYCFNEPKNNDFIWLNILDGIDIDELKNNSQELIDWLK